MSSKQAKEAGDAPTLSSHDRLLIACERLIIEAGPTAMTARKLASEAGVNIAMISYNFGGIEGLLNTVAQDNLDFTAVQVLEAMERQAAEAGISPREILHTLVTALWLPAVHGGGGRASSVIELIYSHASDETRQALSARLQELFLGLVALLQPFFPHLSRDELMLRVTCIAGAIRSMAPRSSAWDVYFQINGKPADTDRALLGPITDFAYAALAGYPR